MFSRKVLLATAAPFSIYRESDRCGAGAATLTPASIDRAAGFVCVNVGLRCSSDHVKAR